mmetsp:Transcript_43101/g.91696  ORF Transcript_43101/g.91696 Transcript_43101/m.91696 type:complete len:129 (-) Transcript_43101:99-485(-)
MAEKERGESRKEGSKSSLRVRCQIGFVGESNPFEPFVTFAQKGAFNRSFLRTLHFAEHVSGTNADLRSPPSRVMIQIRTQFMCTFSEGDETWRKITNLYQNTSRYLTRVSLPPAEPAKSTGEAGSIQK